MPTPEGGSDTGLPDYQLLRAGTPADSYRGTGLGPKSGGLILALIAALLLWEALRHKNPADLIVAILCVGLAFVSWRSTRVGLVLDEQGITAHQLLHNRRWSWEEIERFEFRKTGYGPTLKGWLTRYVRVLVILKNGRSYRVIGIDGRDRGEQARGREISEQLNQRLMAAGGGRSM
jgi:hypothetical protein